MKKKSRVEASYQLLSELKCCSRDLKASDIDDGTALASVEEEKMRCHIINCLMALHIIQMQRRNQNAADVNKIALTKNKVFAAAITIIIDTPFDEVAVMTIFTLMAFPDKGKMSDERLWLPMQSAIIAINLFDQKKISQDDIYILYSTDPLAMRRFNENVDSHVITGCTPAHILCMQKEPNMSLVRHFCLCDPKAFLICDKSGR